MAAGALVPFAAARAMRRRWRLIAYPSLPPAMSSGIDDVASGPGAGLQPATVAGLRIVVLTGRVHDSSAGEDAFFLGQPAEHRTIGVDDP